MVASKNYIFVNQTASVRTVSIVAVLIFFSMKIVLKLLVAATFFIIGVSAIAQDEVKEIASPHAFTPNASEIRKYGKMPVGFFTGTPEISIPLTELKAKGFSVPISLSYHAGGHRPDAHPGWTGLGWSLNAGGRITRVVNDLEDEATSSDEPLNGNNGVGYMNNVEATQGNSWYLSNLSEVMEPLNYKDFAPDEFQIDVDDIHASFYLHSNGEIKIASKGNRSFRANITTNSEIINLNVVKGLPQLPNGHGGRFLKAPVYSFIDRIDIIADDGTKYVFGGDTTAIEFSIVQHSKYGFNVYNDYANLNDWDTHARATSWMLTSIERPNGEIVEFKYVHDGTPIVKNDVHHYEMHSIGNVNEDTRNPGGYNKYPNIGLSFILPCYLTEISSEIGQDRLTFHRSKTAELKYQYTEEEMLWVLGEHSSKIGLIGPETFLQSMHDRDYYLQLDRIEGYNSVVDFSYSADSNKRLTLYSVDIHPKDKTTEQKYVFEYDTTALPSYNSKQTDNWGYYNGKYYGDTQYNLLYSYRTPDLEKAKAEILTKITYPTGGATAFEYELHGYSKIADQLVFQLTPSSGSAGGLRVKKISDLVGMDTVSSRNIIYQDASGVSSGILSGIPVYRVSGTQYNTWDSGWHGTVYTHAGSASANYILASEVSLNPLSTTTGSHVTYSLVKEEYSDGGYTKYYYSNLDMAECRDEAAIRYVDNVDSQVLYNAFCSKELFRGLLIKQEDYNAEGHMVQKAENIYDLSDDNFIKSVEEQSYFGNSMKRAALIKIYTGYPGLTYQTITNYSDSGQSSRTVEHRTYNGRLLTSTQKTIYGGDTLETRYRYSGQLTGGIFTSMKARGMTAIPIEVMTLRNGNIVGGTLTEWRQNSLNNSFVPWKEYKLELSSPLATSGFFSYDGQTRDSHYGTPEMVYSMVDKYNNITEFVGRDNVPVSVIWGYGGLYPVARITGLTNSALNSTYDTELLYPSFLPRQTEEMIRLAGEKIDSWRWDVHRGVIRKTDASGRSLGYLYDKSGRLILSTDENGRAVASQTYKYHQAQ